MSEHWTRAGAAILALVGISWGCTPASMRTGTTSNNEVVPAPRQVRTESDSTVGLAGATVVVDSALEEEFPVALQEIRSRLRPSTGVTASEAAPPVVEVRIGSVGECGDSERPCGALARPEGYWITVRQDSVTVVGADTLGALHGLSTLQSLMTGVESQVPVGEIGDWPRLENRAFHFVAEKLTRERARELVRRARRLKYNTIMVQLADIRPFLDPPQKPVRSGWDAGALDSLATYVRRNGLAFVPEMKLLTHQEKFFRGVRPDLLFNSRTYDPRKQETYDVVFGILNRVVERLRPSAVHIGHDEVVGTGAPGAAGRKELEAGQEPLPAHLFLRDVRKVHTYLSELGMETWMWGDMLISAEEFPGMFPNHLHATPDYRAIRDSIPEDIVICDWHYFGSGGEFPSARTFADAGHEVLGATWKREKIIWSFSKAIGELGNNGKGMIATTWFHVQKKEWDIVERILRISTEAFWHGRE